MRQSLCENSAMTGRRVSKPAPGIHSRPFCDEKKASWETGCGNGFAPSKGARRVFAQTRRLGSYTLQFLSPTLTHGAHTL